jgi:dTMP kinase
MIPPQQPTTDCTMNTPRGAFILVEGVDRCGKTTQCKNLIDRFISAGIAATLMRFPDRTTSTGMIINDYLQNTATSKVIDDHAIHLAFSANRWESASTLVQHLQKGTTVVCDRYVYSGVAFSAAKIKSSLPLLPSENHNETETVTFVDAAATSATITLGGNDEQEVQLLDMEWCKAPDRGLPAPDCVLFLNVSPEAAEMRGGYVARYCFWLLQNTLRSFL